MAAIKNPILRGFNPDPSIVNVNGNYYIATSTFEYFPGVQIHHSTDLVNWEVISRPLDTSDVLNMEGNPASGGIWAPGLSYHDGTFYLVFTNVLHHTPRPFKDTPNYLTTAKNITGPWSKPVYLNSSGFDPFLFIDDDNKKYVLNMQWDYRNITTGHFSGILLQEYDEVQQKLVGPVKNIFKGSIGTTEGPNIFKKDGYYYLVLAEGGTSYRHAVTVARSRAIDGPYELHPNNPVLTSYETNNPLQKAGHGSFMQVENGNWYLVHLCGRPLPNTKNCVLGRETAIQEISWENDWPYLKNKTNQPSETIEIEGAYVQQTGTTKNYLFDNDSFLNDFHTLRIPYLKELFSLTDRPGFLRIYGKESILSRHKQAVLVRRQDAFIFEVETSFEFKPMHFGQLAGLIYRYNENNQYYCYMTYNEIQDKNELQIIKVDQGEVSYVNQEPIYFNESKIYLKMEVNYDKAQFYYSLTGNEFTKFGPSFDTTILSDEYARGFTGAMVGIASQDMFNQTSFADFAYFTYKSTF